MYQPNDVNFLLDFQYYVSSIKDFIKNIDSYPVEWENSLVMSHGTLMYCYNSGVQNKFLKILQNKGCKNFVFHEYTSDKLIKNGNLSEHARNNGLGWLKLNRLNLKLFKPPLGQKINFRDKENDMNALIHLQK